MPIRRETKKETDYTPHAAKPTERCALCSHFQAPIACEIVTGKISPRGWCKRFNRKLQP
jgi:hypothetical protein